MAQVHDARFVSALVERNASLTQYFIVGAPALCLDNINPAMGLANGSRVVMRAVCGLDDESRDKISNGQG